jgi:hypothetical protein
VNNDVGRGIRLDESQQYLNTWLVESCNQVSFATYFKRTCSLAYSIEGKRICLDYLEVHEEGVEGTSSSTLFLFSRASV